MTTLFSTTMTARQAPAIPRGRVALVALWLTQIALAGMFTLAGVHSADPGRQKETWPSI